MNAEKEKPGKFWVARMPLNTDMVRLDLFDIVELENKVKENEASGKLWKSLFKDNMEMTAECLKRMREDSTFGNFTEKSGWIGFGTTRTAALRALCAARDDFPRRYLED